MAVQQTRAERPADVLIVGAEDRIRTRPSRPVLSRLFQSSLLSVTANSHSVTYYLVPPRIGKFVGKMSAIVPTAETPQVPRRGTAPVAGESLSTLFPRGR